MLLRESGLGFREQGYQNLRSKRNLENGVSDEIVDAFIESTKAKGSQQAKRYCAFKIFNRLMRGN